MKSHGVYQGDGNPNEITVYHECDLMDDAKAFANSDVLKAAMQRSGVVRAPGRWFATRV